MSFSTTPIASTKVAGLNGGTTPAIDTTGAKLLLIRVAHAGAATVSDSKGNTWVAGTSRTNSATGLFYYALNPIVGSGHTFTIAGSNIVASMIVEAHTATNNVALDSQAVPHDFSGSVAQLGYTDFTPTTDNCLVVAGQSFAAGFDAGYAPGSGWTGIDVQYYGGGTNFGCAMSFKVQGAAAAIPTTEQVASWTGAVAGVYGGIAFKEVAAAGIVLTDVVDFRIIQRSGTSGTLSISGSYTGTPGTIQARVVQHGTSTEVVPWTTIVNTPSGGVFTGQLAGIPQGGWYNVQVRQGSAPAITANGTHRFGVGALIAVIGQSQGVKWFSDGAAVVPSPLLAQYSGSAGTGWAQRPQAGDGANAFGNAMIAALGGTIPVALLSYAVGGTALLQGADTMGNGYWMNTAAGALYDLFKQGATSAGGKLEACVWMQGEQDGYSNAVTEATYASNLATLLARIRTDLAQASLPIVISPLANYANAGPTDASWEGIRRAQVTVGGQANNTLAAFNQDLALSDGVHYTAAAYAIHGTRAARAARAALGLSTYARGPVISGATKASPTSIEVTIAHRGGSDITPASAITGFQVLDNGTPVTVSAAARTSATKITLTLAAALVGTATLRYQYGATPAVSAPVLDNSAEALPLGLESAATITVTAPDTTAPTLSGPTAAATGQTTAAGSVTTNEGNGTLYYFASANASETAATIKASGQTQAVSAAGALNVTVFGLPAGATRYLHFVHRDAAGNDSAAAHSAAFTTDAAPRARLPLFQQDGTTPAPDQAGLTFAWYPAYPPDFSQAAAVTGTAAIAAGEVDVSAAGSAIGSTGTLLLLKGDGVAGSASNVAFSGPVVVSA